jgi:antirestriction protein ArdC
MKNYTEFCNEQIEKLFQIIEQHDGLLKWRKTWQVNGCFSLPQSVHGHYRGINLWKLLLEQVNRGLVSDTWLTFNQIKQQGANVLKGAKGTQVCFFKLKEAEVDDLVEGDKQKMAALFRVYTVFNLDQTSLAGQGGDKSSLMPKKLQQLISILGVNISEFGNRAYYSPSDDIIVMPRREYFENEHDYDATLLHELVHFSGIATRLDRECAKNYTISDAARAEEELVAEIGSVFLTSYFGISGDLVNHASYVASWKKYLDPKAVGRAMSQASKAFSWLVTQLEGQEVEAAA